MFTYRKRADAKTHFTEVNGSRLGKVSGAVTQDNQRYVLVVGSLLTDNAHNCSIRVFAYCSPLLASTLTSDNF
jgi:hypothetical protein